MPATELDFECEWECQRLFLTFMQCLDAGEADGAVAVVTPDVIWHRQGQKLLGPASIREVLDSRPTERVIRHHLSNIVVTREAPERAKSKAYYSVYVNDGSGRPRLIEGPERVGDYYARYVRTAQGWRISSLQAERLFAAVPRR